MTSADVKIPNLTERFLAPAGWRTHDFTNPDTGRKLHYGSVAPQGVPPRAAVVCLGGLSEFAEKYYEVAHDMLGRGYAFWFMDWHYQGHSGRLEKFPQRRHSDGFAKDISDFDRFICDYVKPSAVHPQTGRIPLIMLGHSMGGNIGLQYLSRFPGIFDAAAFSAPFLGIHDFKWPMRALAAAVKTILPLVGKNYVFGGRDWHETMRKSDGTDIFSSHPVRDSLHNAWSKADPTLQVGNVTFGWVIEALTSCAQLNGTDAARRIDIPVLIAMAGQEKIVDNNCIAAFAKNLPHGTLLEIPDAHHEIIMETDECRNMFFNAFDKMVEENKIALKHTPEPV